MLPVLDLANLRLALLKVRSKDVVLYGFLLYTDLDTVLVEYVKLAFGEVDGLAGSECVIFVIEAPPTEWIEIAHRKSNPWMGILRELKAPTHKIPAGPVGVQEPGAKPSAEARQDKLAGLVTVLIQNPELCAFELSTEEVAGARHLLDPKYQLPYNRTEALEVAKFFGVKLDEIPCLVLFEHLDASEIWKLKLGRIQSVKQATTFFRKAFASSDFERILTHARTYARTA